MGWDAYSEPWCGSTFRAEQPQHPDYRAAAARVRAEVGSYDGLLALGGLDCSPCAYAMGIALADNPYLCWSDEPWSPAVLAAHAARADWARPMVLAAARHGRQHDVSLPAWAVASAKAFVEVTVALGRGVHFSF